MDGPVVMAAKSALESNNVNLILPWVPKSAENEVIKAFSKTLEVRKCGKEEESLADQWFFETVVRLHRMGEGKGFTGLKLAGLDWGPVVPKADKAIEEEDSTELVTFILNTVENELKRRFDIAMDRKNYKIDNIDEAREYVHAMLEFVLFSHHLYKFITENEMHD